VPLLCFLILDFVLMIWKKNNNNPDYAFAPSFNTIKVQKNKLTTFFSSFIWLQ